MNKVFQDIFRLEVEKMVKESEYIEPMKHKGVKGAIRELGLSNFLKKFLPTYLNVGNGEIHDKNGNISNQTDLVIYNKDILPPILFDNELGIYPIEAIVYAVEIKSTSTRKEVKSTVDKFKKLRELEYKNKVGLRKVYFAYKSNLKNGSELERYSQLDNLIDPCIQIICVIGDGYYFYVSKNIRFYGINNNGQVEYKCASKYIAWVGIRTDNKYEAIAFIAGVLNTTRPQNIGGYVLDEGDFNTYYEAILDENEKVLYEHKNFMGIDKNDMIKVSY